MTEYELLCVIAAIAAASGERSPEGAVDHARRIVDAAKTADPAAFDAHVRSRMTAARRRPCVGVVQHPAGGGRCVRMTAARRLP
jgi:hypothetical protein